MYVFITCDYFELKTNCFNVKSQNRPLSFVLVSASLNLEYTYVEDNSCSL